MNSKGNAYGLPNIYQKYRVSLIVFIALDCYYRLIILQQYILYLHLVDFHKI